VVIIPVLDSYLVRAAGPLYYEVEMTWKPGRFIVAVFIIAAIIILIYGFYPWFRPSVTKRKLSNPNPTSFVFAASVTEVHRVLADHAVRCCGKAIEFKKNALF
jgi:hypothetical protein